MLTKSIRTLCALLLMSSVAAAESNWSKIGNWGIRTTKSPVDNSPLIIAILLSEDTKSALGIRCSERNIDVTVGSSQFIRCRANIRTIYRFDQNPAVETSWHGSTGCDMAFAPTAINFLKSMKDNNHLFVRLYDFRGQPHDATFNLSQISKVRDHIIAACRWDKSKVTSQTKFQ